MTTTTQRATSADAGCWIDGHWGQYGITRLIEIANGHGFPLSPEDETAVETYNAGDFDFESDGQVYDAADWVVQVGDDAEAWLNENVAPEGFSFGWHDGEFFLWSTADWEEEN